LALLLLTELQSLNGIIYTYTTEHVALAGLAELLIAPVNLYICQAIDLNIAHVQTSREKVYSKWIKKPRRFQE